MPGTMRILNTKVGDVRVAWGADEEAEMEALIQRKMDQGIKFFIVVPGEVGDGKQILLPKQRVPSREVFIRDQDVGVMFGPKPLEPTSTVVIPPVVGITGDADIDTVVSSGTARLFNRIMSGIESIRMALTAREAAQSDTLMFRPFVGG